jgi:replicative DNA helicase
MTDKLPPHSTEAEQGILGCIMDAPLDSLMECAEKFGNDPEIFYLLTYRTIFQEMVWMLDEGIAIDLITLQQRLKDSGKLDFVGGLAFIAGLSDSIPSPAHLPNYIIIAQEKQTLRKVVKFATELVGRVYECSDVPSLIDSMESAALAVRRQDARGFSDIKAVQDKILVQAQDAHEGKPIVGFKTGLMDLDLRIGVIEMQTVIMLSAVPSAGKTSLAVNIVNDILHNQGGHVGVFSLETSDVRFVRRMICADSRLSAKHLKDGSMVGIDFNKLCVANSRLSKVRDRLHISDQGGLTIAQLRAKARRMAQLGTRFFVIDYLQLLSSGNQRHTKTEGLDAISMGIKEMAKELDAVILAIASESREGGIRGSGQFDYDADAKWRLETDSKDLVRDVTLQITKDKESGFGSIDLTFLSDCMRFESKAKISDEDVRKNYDD